MAEYVGYITDGGTKDAVWLDTEHPLSSYGIGVLIIGDSADTGYILSGSAFRYSGRTIFATPPSERDRIYRALGVSVPEIRHMGDAAGIIVGSEID